MPCSSLCLHSGSHFYEMFDSLVCLGLHVLSSLFAMHIWQDTYFRNVWLNLPFRVREDLMHFSAVQVCLVSLPIIHFSHTKLVSVCRVTHSPPPLLLCQRHLLHCKKTDTAALEICLKQRSGQIHCADSICANSRCLSHKWERSLQLCEYVCDGSPLVIILLQ